MTTTEKAANTARSSILAVVVLFGGGGGVYGGTKLDAVLTELRAISIAAERRDERVANLERRVTELETLHPRTQD